MRSLNSIKYLNIESWNRKQHFEFFNQFLDPYFEVTADVEVTKAYQYSKKTGFSFFALYLHACMKAINSIENFKYRIEEDKIAIHPIIHASTTILKPNNTFGFSFIFFDKDFKVFYQNFLQEKKRSISSTELFPPVKTENCVFCSALPWISFSGHKEPNAGFKINSVPKLAFGKFKEERGKKLMPVSISVNHALLDGYHVGVFFEKYQKELNNLNL